jgi:hypothetical protein
MHFQHQPVAITSLVGRFCWSRGLLSALASSTEISRNEGDAFDPE